MRASWLAAASLVLAAACGPPEDTGEPYDPTKSDKDGDGLSDADEAVWGSDPDNPDSDDDGYEDGAEVKAGTHPVNFYSHPYAGGYNVGQCAMSDYPTPLRARDLESGHYANGDAPEDFYLWDQHGEEVDSWAFCGRHLMLIFGTGWCKQCKDISFASQGIMDQYRDRGFQLMWVLTEDAKGYAPSTDYLATWAGDRQMTDIPVVADPDYKIRPSYEIDGDLPTIVHIGPDARILSIDEGVESPSQWF